MNLQLNSWWRFIKAWNCFHKWLFLRCIAQQFAVKYVRHAWWENFASNYLKWLECSILWNISSVFGRSEVRVVLHRTNKTYKMFLNECNEPCFKFNPPFYAKHVYYPALARCAAVTSVLFSFEFKEEPCQGLVLPAPRRLNDPRFQSNFVCCSGRLFRRSMIAW